LFLHCGLIGRPSLPIAVRPTSEAAAITAAAVFENMAANDERRACRRTTVETVSPDATRKLGPTATTLPFSETSSTRYQLCTTGAKRNCPVVDVSLVEAMWPVTRSRSRTFAFGTGELSLFQTTPRTTPGSP